VVSDGYYQLPHQPGVGLKIRDSVVARHRVR
jgi:L-alanine-DL-glutamate epimerase-like enolase superfamily enzyme